MDPLFDLMPSRAIDVAATRRSLNRSTAVVVAGVVVGLLALAYGVGLWWTQQSLHWVESSGPRTSATVDDVTSTMVTRQNFVVGTVHVSYQVDGRTYHASFSLGDAVKRYDDGQTVEVAYDPGRPELAVLTAEPVTDAGRIPWPVMAGAGIFLLAMFGGGLRHRLAIRRILREHAWLAVPARLEQIPLSGRGTLSAVVLREPNSRQRLVASTVGLRRLHPEVEPVAWVAGWGRNRFVLAPAGGRPVIAMRALRDDALPPDPEDDAAVVDLRAPDEHHPGA